MRILVLSTFDNKGGAAKAASRFSEEFVRQGDVVRMYVMYKSTNKTFVKESADSKFGKRIRYIVDYLPGYILSGFRKECPFTLGMISESITEIVNDFKPDVINVHWTWKGFISFKEICTISRKIPVVWTMHDASLFRGGLFYPSSENKYHLVKLLATINSLLRHKYLKGSNITFVSPSKFLLREFRNSKLAKYNRGVAINNGVDRSVFNPKPKLAQRAVWQLDPVKKYILFGAVDLVRDPIKGGKLLKKTLALIEDYLIKNNIGLISYGTYDPFVDLAISSSIERKFLGFINGDDEMSSLLSSIDLVLVPSLYENYPFAVVEPLACNIPVVALEVGGIPELIVHKKNGYLVKGQNYRDFANGIKYCLGNDNLHLPQDFDIYKKAQTYRNLFKDSIKTSV